jgi:membrane protease YdiL (CAAX protease family)
VSAAAQPVTRGRLVSFAVGSAAVAAALACAVSWIRFRSLQPLAVWHAPLPIQLVLGLLVGVVLGSAAVAWFLRSPILADGRAKAREVLASAPLSRGDVVLISVSAGFGEELLFRGALQPWIGFVLSSIVFTLAHYWVPLTGIARVLYAAFVLAVSLVLGFLCLRSGLVAAMTAHASVDLVILWIPRDRLGRA